jgi:6-phosphogluconolactonase (cycloisomerase 2 family)
MTERLEARTLLTSFTVDSYFDTVDADPGDGSALDSSGRTSLRAAIMEANANPDTDIILLSGGFYSLSIEGADEDGAATGDLDVLENLQIFGESPQTTFIDARSIDRVFDVFPGVQLVLFNLTVTGGDLAGRGDGGGVRVDNGTLFLDDSVITNSRASKGGAISNIGGNVTVDRSTLSNNRAEGNSGFDQGGAINSVGGTVTVRQSTIHDNYAQSTGGGISVSADTVGGSLSVESSTIAQNTAGDDQGTSGDGGGIYIQTGVNATILASTVAYNSAGSQGGGVWVNGTLTLERTIISNNSAGSITGPEGFVASGTVISNGFNLVREDTDFTFSSSSGDIIGTSGNPTDPNLLGLADNGGPTPTIALGGMSPAIDQGPSIASPLFVDQRNFPRERDGDRNGSVITDIGAFEVQSPSDFFVDDIGTGVISGGRAGDFVVTIDNGATGILDAGDFVTFDPFGQPIFNLEFGVRAFGTIGDALSAARSSGDFLNEVVIGPGTYTGSLTLDIPGLTLRGHTGIATDVVINGGGAAAGISATEDSISIRGLRVTNAVVGIDVTPLSSAQRFSASNVHVDGNTTGIRIFDSIGLMDVSIENSVVTGNSGDGINIPSVGFAHLRNVMVSLNGQDGIDASNAEIVKLDTVTVDQNGGRGLLIDSIETIAVTNLRTSANASGNLFLNSPVLHFKGVEGDVSNSTTITSSEIQFDAGVGSPQQSILMTNVSTLFVTGDGGNDTLTIDYSAGPPPGSRQLFLDGGFGNDTIISISNSHQRLTNTRLSLAGVDEVAVANFEQAALTGGAGNNNLNATGFDGQATLNGLAGNDTLQGSPGDDVLDGGAGDDILRDGPLVDQYVLSGTAFENLNLNDTDSGVVTILDETDTDTATINLMGDVFRFNDITFSGQSLFVAPSGVASFGGPVFPQDNFDLTDTPNYVGGVPILAPLFDNWVTGLNSPPGLILPDAKVLYLFEDTNADFINDRLIIEWNDVYHRDQIDTTSAPVLKAGASPVTFQVILELNTFDRDGDITFNYVDLDTGSAFPAIADGGSATVGGKDGSDNPIGIKQVSFNATNTLIGSSRAIVARRALSDGNDQLIGGDGDDILVTNSGIDSLDGGAGTNDRLIFDGFNSEFASDHTVNSLAIESTIFETPTRSYDFKSSYSNIEILDIGFGSADQNVTVDLNGLPATVSLDTRGPSTSDSVTISGSAGNDVLTLSGSTLSDGTTTINLAGIENLVLDISSGGSDEISVDQDFTGSARTIMVSGDTADDSISLQSTTKRQIVNTVSGDGYSVQVRENLGGNLVLEELLINGDDDGSENTITDQQAPDQVIVSPDGTRVYVAASDSNSLVVYHRDPVTGDLTFNESLVNSMTDFQGGTITGLDGASNVIVSADGRYVYVASENDQTVAFFVRHQGDNQLTFISSMVFDRSGNLFNIDLPSAMAFSPDGSVLMVSSESGNLVAFLEVAGSGDLTAVGTLVDGGLDSGENTIDGLGGASSLAISPDGRHFYVTGATDNAIAVFSKPGAGGEDGNPTLPLFVQSLANGDMDGLNIVSGIVGASSVTVSPDGQHVYVTGEASNAIAVFSRNSSTGQLTFVESLEDSGLDQMSNSVENLLAPVSVSVSPEGNMVYVAAAGSDAITVFARDFSSGALTFLESLANGQEDGSGTSVAGLTNASSVFASVDGQHVYASGTGDDTVVRFNVPRLLDVSTDGAAAVSITTSDRDDQFSLGISGQPATLSIDAGGSVDNDLVVIQGTVAGDTINVNGSTLTFNGTTLSITNAEALNLMTDDGDDTVNITASATGPAFVLVEGGTQVSGDVLNVDAQASQVDNSGSNITFSGGLQAVNYAEFETVAITNATPTIEDDTFSIAENASPGAVVGTANASDPETGESLTWRIVSGNTGSAFAIDSSTGEITVNAELDFEVLNFYSLIVEVEDNQTLTDTATITINVDDVEPTISNQSFNLLENQPNGTSVGTVVLDSGDMNGVAFSIIGGNTGSAFAINSSTGQVTVANTSVIDFESRGGFILQVQVTDDGGTTTDTATVNIDIQDANESPMINAQSFSVNENSPVTTIVGTVLANDFETPSGLTFAITAGDPGGLFLINASTGTLRVAKNGLDHEAISSFDLTVRVTDPGMLSESATITVNINDLNEPPILDPIGNQSATVDQELSFTATASDPDLPPLTLTFSLEAGAPVGAFITSGGNFTFTPTSALDGMSTSVTIIVTEGTAGALTASETILISVSSVELDFGDAPSSFKTTLADDGPRHVVGSLFLGNAIDSEADGIASPMALGDDSNSSEELLIDDEDGITFLSALNIGKTRQFRVFASQAGFLDSWIDFDQSGDFNMSESLSPAATLMEGSSGSESGGGSIIGAFNVSSGIAVPAGFSTVSFNIPSNALPGPTFARFRFSSTGGLASTGLAGDGEVEDYLVNIVAPPVGNSNSIESALDTAVGGFFGAFPDELNDPDPNITGNELPLAVQAENGAQARRVNGNAPLDQTDPALRVVIQAINDAVNRLEQNRGRDENILVLAFHPVDFLLTDTQGRSVGFTQAQGTVNQIGADATFTGDGVVELLTIRNADPGEYGLQLVGVGGVFRGGSSLITPAGTQRITFQGSLAQDDAVQLALTYQEGLFSFPSRTDLEQVNFSEIADIVAKIPTAESNAKTLAAGATEALASIALDRLDATLFSRKDEEELSLQKLLEQISEARQRLLDAIETSLDEDELDSLKLVFGDNSEDADSVEILARVLLETLSGPLISAPRQVDDLSNSLQQLLEQLREQQKDQQPQRNNQQPSNTDDSKGATKSESEEKRTSQRSPDRNSSAIASRLFVVTTDDVAVRHRVDRSAWTGGGAGSTDTGKSQLRGPKFIAANQPAIPQSENVSRETVTVEPSDTSTEE